MHLSTLDYALLVLLAREPLSGYDLAQQMKRPLAFFWQAQLSQIYPELAKLEAHGYILHRVVEQEDRPRKKLYNLTDQGREALKEWVTLLPPPPQERNEFLLKTYAIWQAEPSHALELFQQRKQLHVQRLALFERIQQDIEEAHQGGPRPSEPRFGDYATVRIGVAYEREYMHWCDWVIQQFEQEIERRGEP